MKILLGCDIYNDLQSKNKNSHNINPHTKKWIALFQICHIDDIFFGLGHSLLYAKNFCMSADRAILKAQMQEMVKRVLKLTIEIRYAESSRDRLQINKTFFFNSD